jgi:hypothetical protein
MTYFCSSSWARTKDPLINSLVSLFQNYHKQWAVEVYPHNLLTFCTQDAGLNLKLE